jgi:CubicO group peptidase (beta-lactamase class C family)
MSIFYNKQLLPIFVLSLLVVGCTENNHQKVESKKEMAINNLALNDSTVYSVEQAMALYKLKGLSVAVIEDYRIIWTDTWGVKDVETLKPIDNNTAFSTASISKPVTATLFAILEEKGLINLKDPVSTYLKRWQLPKSDYLKDININFEHLLSHTAGTTQHGFTDFYKGDTIPTLVQSLKGQLPRYDKEIAIQWKPGTHWSYSGGGYVIAQMAVEDHLGKSLADLADEHLFRPLGLKNTTMKQPNEKDFLINVAKAHNEDGKIVGTGIPITPQVAPSGQWSTPGDMALFLIEIQNALRDRNNSIISQQVAQRVTKIITSKVLGGWGLGWERRFAFGNYDWFSHGGSNTGIGGHIYATMKDGNGIVFFGNGANSNRLPILDALRNSIVKAQDWYIPLSTEQKQPLPEEVINMVLGKYIHVLFGEEVKVYLKEKKLFIKGLVGTTSNELVYIGDTTFLVDEFNSKLMFEKSEKDGALHINLIRNTTFEKRKVYKKI